MREREREKWEKEGDNEYIIYQLLFQGLIIQ